MTRPPGEIVPVHEWLSVATQLRADGCDFFDILVAIDRPDRDVIEIVLGVENSRGGHRAFRQVDLPRSMPVVASVSEVWKAAQWHEREIADMFAVEFTGDADCRPLLLADRSGPAPLRKENYLPRRQETPWPGAVDDPVKKSRRPATPLGVPGPERRSAGGGHGPE